MTPMKMTCASMNTRRFPPSFSNRHFLGTDNVGRDVLARLVYGFRTAILFSLGLLFFNYTVGISLGCAMGYFRREI